MELIKKSALIISALALSACSSMDMGNAGAKTAATGSAGGSNTKNANSKLERCDHTLGTVAIVEDTSAPWYGHLTGEMHLGPTTPVLKLLVQQTGCFVVVDRGRGMDASMIDRRMRDSGELRGNSNMKKGQMVAADYLITPSITFSNNNAGGAGAALGAFLGPIGGLVAGGMQSKEASTLLTLVDGRSTVQIAAAEGSAKNFDFGGIAGALGGGVLGAAGGYTNTAEGKVIVAAFTDSLNNLIIAVKDYKAQTVKGGLGTGGHLKVN